MGKTGEDGAARGERRAHQGRGMTGDERSSSVLSRAATEMNSHHLDCTITGGRGRWRGKGRGGEGSRRLSGLFMQSRILEVGLCFILKCFIMVMMGFNSRQLL